MKLVDFLHKKTIKNFKYTTNAQLKLDLKNIIRNIFSKLQVIHRIINGYNDSGFNLLLIDALQSDILAVLIHHRSEI
jgi:hypothetical protein